MIEREISRPSPEDTRAKIFHAAREIFAVRGPHGTTTREIADRAGVNEATLFRHFGNKQALLHSMKEYYCEGKEARFRALSDSFTGDLDADLRTLARAMIEGMMQNRDLILVALFEESSDPTASHAPWRMPNMAREFLTTFLDNFVHKGELHGDPGVLARVFMGMIFSYVVRRQFWQDEMQSEDAVNIFCDVFLNGTRSK